ncbi:MAG: polyprenyl synthetase family protein, partial [Candidatus Puniceispirillaceae bacterium]
RLCVLFVTFLYICDGDMVRRGAPSVWAQYGKDTALALGDWLIALSFELAAEAAVMGQTPGLVRVLSHHMAATTTGQALEFAIDSYPGWAKYMDISTGKTAPLFVASVEGIAHLADRNDIIAPLQRFFTAAGGCYQIANDMLNVIGKDGAASPASDLLRRAPNAVIVMFRTTLDREQASAFDKWLASGTDHNALDWQTRLRRSPALSMTASALMSMFDEAESSSDALPSDCQAIITPIKAQLRHVCRDLVADNS